MSSYKKGLFWAVIVLIGALVINWAGSAYIDHRARLNSKTTDMVYKGERTAKGYCEDERQRLESKIKQLSIKEEDRVYFENWKKAALQISGQTEENFLKQFKVIGAKKTTNRSGDLLEIEYIVEDGWWKNENREWFWVGKEGRVFQPEEIEQEYLKHIPNEERAGKPLLKKFVNVNKYSTCEEAAKEVLEGLDVQLINGIAMELGNTDDYMGKETLEAWEIEKEGTGCKIVILNLETKIKTVYYRTCNYY